MLKTPKPTRSDRRIVRNRKSLLTAAEALFAHKGVGRVTIDEITESADLAKGTFYRYFKDKEAVAREVALAAREDIESKVQMVQTGVDDPAQRLALGISVFFRSATTEPARATIVAQMFGQWLRPEAAGNVRLCKDLEDGYRIGRFSTADLAAAVVMTVGVVQAGITRAIGIDDRQAVQALSLELCLLTLRALGLRWNEVQRVSAKAVTHVFAADWGAK